MNNNFLSEIQISYTPSDVSYSNTKITTSQEACIILKGFFNSSLLNIKEEAVVLFLNRASKVIGVYKLSSGGLTGTVVDVRLILSIALKCLACGLIISHNHPSGELKPSKCDLDLTAKLKQAARLMDITLLDHIILTTDDSFSFAENGLL